MAFSQAALAATIWSEAGNGDLSGNRLAPTSLPLAVGTNTIIGNTTSGDLDYFTFSVPAGAQLAEMRLTSFTADDFAFLAIQSGSVFSEPNFGTNPANLLGYVHLSLALVGSDVLDDMGASNLLLPAAHGFSIPLGAGPYSFWMQQLNFEPTGYSYDVVIVPEPSAAAILALGLGLLAAARRRL